MSVSSEAPPKFHLTGRGNFMFFEIALRSGQVVWKIHPKEPNVSVGQISVIKYGDIPSTCLQLAPANSPPPPLIEGEIYFAAAMATDSAGVQIRFTIKNGKVVEIP